MSLRSEEPLHIEERSGPKPDQRILVLNGPLVLANLFRFQDALRSKLSRSLVIDFTRVPYIDSAGIGALVGAHISYSKHDRSLALVGVSERVHSAFEITHVDPFFRTFPTVESALEGTV